MKPTHVLAVVSLGVALLATGCDSGISASQSGSQDLTEKIAAHATNPAAGGVAYPYDDMAAGHWMEERMLAEHLKRQANPKAQRYIILIAQTGQIIGQWPIQGMMFDPNSQMTTPKMVTCNPHYTNGSDCGAVVDAPGDNGTYGPEAGVAAFFTTAGVEIQIGKGVTPVESDAPLDLTTKPILTINENATPSVNGGGVHVGR
jgi:hypothetical protein